MTEPPQIRLLNLISGFIVTQAVGTAVRLGIPDLLADRPRTVVELAEASAASQDALGRLIRALVSLGVFAEEDGVVRNNEVSELLRSDVPMSLEASARLFSGLHFRTWTEAFDSLKTGAPAFQRVHGEPMWEWFGTHPDDAAVFNRAMANGAVRRRMQLLEYDWSGVEDVVDVGGGTAATLTALLREQPHLTGTVFDLEHACEEAERTIAAAGVEGRCRFVSGSFFETVPPGADAYVLSAILHDWDDERAAAILRTCRTAARPDSRLILVEAIMVEGDEPDWMKLLDLHMLVALGGRERNEVEWRALLESAGFRLDAARDGLLEASPA